MISKHRKRVNSYIGYFLYLGFVSTVISQECVSGDCENGNGNYVWSNGDNYDGMWSKGLPHGYGKLIWGEGEWKGNSYEGMFLNGNAHGKGSLKYPNGDRYEGNYQNNLKHGDGTYFYANGSREPRLYKDGIVFAKNTITDKNMITEYSQYVKPKYPASLFINELKFIEPSGNQSLEGLESGKIAFDLINKGRGYASNMKITVTSLTFGKNLDYSDTIILKKLDSKSSETINIPISADKNVKTENREFKIDITEHFGFDADPAVISFTTTAFVPSNLQIEKIIVDDDEDGDSFGNGNGIIELGESIEVVVRLKNLGGGIARNVKATVVLSEINNNLTYPDEGKVYNLGSIDSGESKEMSFYFFTNKRYDQSKLPISINLWGSIGFKDKTIDLGLMIAQKGTNSERKMETVITKDGKEINGIIIKKDSNHIWMEDLDGKTIKISVDEIEFIRSDRKM